MKKPILTAALLLSFAVGSLAAPPAFAEDPASATPSAQSTDVAGAATAEATPAPTATDTASTTTPTDTTSGTTLPSEGAPPSNTAPATTSPAPAPTTTSGGTPPSGTTTTAEVADPAVTPEPTVTTPAPAPPPAITVRGAIGTKWRAMNGAAGVLGVPLANEVCSAGVCGQTFKGGTIYWTSATGAHPVLLTAGRTGPHWHANGGRALFGYPVTDEAAVTGGTIQKFSTGRMLASSTKGVFQIWLKGAIGSRWTALGGAAVVGVPLSKETCGLREGGCNQVFSKGYIYWSPNTWARMVSGIYYTRWVGMGGLNGVMGYPTSDLSCGKPAGGCVQTWQRAIISWSSASGAWVTKGAIGGRYISVGGVRSSLGYPTTNEKCTPGQCIQSFQRGYIGWVPAGTRIYAMTECAKLNNGRTKYSAYGANRVLLTFTGGYKQAYATNIYCMRVAGLYVADWKTDGYVGASGFKPPGVPSGPTRYLFSPTGSYSVTEAFGLGNPGTKLAYRTLNPNSRWGGNPWTPTYNKYFESSSWVGWDENMWYFATRSTHDYRQGVVINYNRPNIVQNAGFAIFLHMNKVPTAGCISLDDWAVVDYIRKSTPGDRIIMGTYNDIFR